MCNYKGFRNLDTLNATAVELFYLTAITIGAQGSESSCKASAHPIAEVGQTVINPSSHQLFAHAAAALLIQQLL